MKTTTVLTALLVTLFITMPAAAENFTIVVPDAISIRVIDGCSYRMGYSDTIQQPSGITIPNPQTKKEYCLAQLRFALVTAVKEYEVEQASKNAERSARVKVKAEVADLIPKFKVIKVIK